MEKQQILLISSDGGFATSVSQALSMAGYVVSLIGSSQEALMKMKMNKPSLVIVDASTTGVDGFSFLEQMKQASSLQDVMVIAFYDNKQTQDGKKLQELGASEVLEKQNIDSGDLVNTIQKYLNNSSTKAAEESKSTEFGGNKKLIMLIEDDPFLHKIMTEQLEGDSSFKVMAFVDAESALSGLEKQTPDLILLDLLLPGMNGYEFLEKVKSDTKWKNIPVLILSNFGQEEDVERAKKLGAEEFLVKAHYVPEEIISKIKKVLSQHS